MVMCNVMVSQGPHIHNSGKIHEGKPGLPKLLAKQICIAINSIQATKSVTVIF